MIGFNRIHNQRKVPLRFSTSLGRDRLSRSRARTMSSLRRTTLELPDLPAAWDGLTILQISDVHTGPYSSIRQAHHIRHLATGLEPDMVVFTGDQLDRRRSDADRFVAGYSGFEAPLGVWGVLGNHDHATDPELAVWSLHKAGIRPLINESVTFSRAGQGLALTGLDDLDSLTGAPNFAEIGNHLHAFRICLCHQPNGWHTAARAGAHLTLAGHTHGGQIALTTRHLNMARLGTRYIAGPYRREDAFLYVSRGVGVGAVPVRFGAPPEIDLLTLSSPAVAKRAAA